MSTLPSSLAGLGLRVHAWIIQQRSLHFPATRGLRDEEKLWLDGYFLPETLRQARVRSVTQIENPPFYDAVVQELAAQGIEAQFDVRGSLGITFVDCILLRQGLETPALLFHEMVHVVQYGLLGSEKFAACYVQGLAGARFVYRENPFERIAHQMEERFVAGEPFKVLPEVAEWCRRQGYAVR
jgi:hypothetical protein